MRFLLFLLLLGGAAAGAFYCNSNIRETVRGHMIDSSDRERFEAYKQGKSLLKASWPEAAQADFKSWGDDASETASLVSGTLWLARGKAMVPVDGTKTETPWCIEFDRTTGNALGRASGTEAAEVLRKLDSGELKPTNIQTEGPARKIVVAPSVTPKPTPVPGAWMWQKDGRGALEMPTPRKR